VIAIGCDRNKVRHINGGCHGVNDNLYIAWEGVKASVHRVRFGTCMPLDERGHLCSCSGQRRRCKLTLVALRWEVPEVSD
jgi:hypothetical protein